MPVTLCPSAEQLAAFHAGKLKHGDLDDIAQHLESCAACQTALASGGTLSDVLVLELKQAQRDDTYAAEPDCGRAVAWIEALGDMHGTKTRDDTAENAPPTMGPPTSPPRTMLGKYHLLAPIGHGGMGEVFKATHTVLKKTVAVKVLPAGRLTNPDAIARFRREIEAAGRLDHPHIVRALDAEHADGQHFLVMEWLAGQDLAHHVRDHGALPIEQACDFIRQAALGLDCAHQNGLVHRDVKPSNLMLTSVDGVPTVKVLDLGLALLHDNVAAESELTSAGQVMGTYDFIAPEQAMESHSVDARADIYSLGCTFYYLLTAHAPFQGKSETKKLLAHQLDEPTPLTTYRTNVPTEVMAVLARMMAKDPGKRYQSMKEVAQALPKMDTQIVEAQTLPRSSPRPLYSGGEGPGVRGPMRPLLVAAALAFGLIAAVLIVVGVIRFSTPEGDYTIATDDPDFTFTVSKGTVNLHDKKTKRTYNLKAVKQESGEYEVEVTDEDAGLSFKTKKLTIKRGETAALQAWFERKQEAVAKGTPVDEAWIKLVGTMFPKNQVDAVAAKLTDLNPGFDGKVTHLIEDGAVTELGFSTDNKLTDISPVRALLKLRKFRCPNTSVADLSPLKGMPLTTLDIHNTQVSDLAPLKGMKLTFLNCGQTQVADLSCLRDAVLTTLVIEYTKVADLSPVSGMNLTLLRCNNTQVSDLSPLKGAKLTRLDCHDTAVSDLTPLKGMPLTKLTLSNTRVADLSALKGISLTELTCDSTKVANLTPLREMRLTKLTLNNSHVSDLSPISEMPLTQLNLHNTKVQDLSPLKNMKLTDLGFAETEVSDLSPLRSMPLRILDCGSTKVSDLSPIKDLKLTRFTCWGTGVDLSPLKGMQLKSIRCDPPLERDAAILRSIKTLDTINDKPATEFWKEVDASKAKLPTLVHHLKKHTDAVETVAINADGSVGVSGGADNRMRFWDLVSGLQTSSDVLKSSVTIAGVSQDGRHALVGEHAKFQVWDVAARKVVGTQSSGSTGHVHRLAFSPDNKSVLTCGWAGAGGDRRLRWWKLDQKGLQVPSQTLAMPTDVGALAFADADHAVVACYEGTVHTVDLVTGNPSKQSKLPVVPAEPMDFSGDGNLLLYIYSDKTTPGRFTLYDWRLGKTLQEHSVGARVRTVALAPSGKWALFACKGESAIRLWDLALGKEAGRFESHNSEVLSVSISRDGRFVLAGCKDGSVCLWRMPADKADTTPAHGEVRTYLGHSGIVKAVAFAPDGKSFLSGGSDGKLFWWDIEHATPKKQWPDSKKPFSSIRSTFAITQLAFSKDGSKAVSGGADHIVRVWDVKKGMVLNHIELSTPKTPSSCSFALSPDDRYLWIAGETSAPRLYLFSSLEEGKALYGGRHGHFSKDGDKLLTLEPGLMQVYDLAKPKRVFVNVSDIHHAVLTPDGRYAICGGLDSMIYVWDMVTRKQVHKMAGHKGTIQALAMSPDGKRALSGGGDGMMRLWDLTKGEQVRAFEGHHGSVVSVAFSPDGTHALSAGSTDKSIKLWQLPGARTPDVDAKTPPVGEIRRYVGHQDGVRHVVFSPDGKTFLSTSSGELWLWDIDSATERIQFPNAQGNIQCAGFSHGGERVVGPAQIGTVVVWDAKAKAGEKVTELARFKIPGWIEWVAASPDKPHIFYTARIGGRVYDLDKNAEAPVRFLGEQASLSKDGRRLLSGDGATLYLWDADTGKELSNVSHPRGIGRVALSADGRYALACADKEVYQWDMVEKKELPRLKTPATVYSLAISPDGKRALTGGLDKKMRLWDLQTGTEIQSFDGHTGPVSSVAFSPDGRQALSGGGDKTIRLWQLPADAKTEPVKKEEIELAPWPDLKTPVELELTTKLGVKAQVRVRRAGCYKHEYLQQLASLLTPTCPKLALDLGNGAYVLIPFRAVKQSVVKDKQHEVTLIDGSTYSGKFLTTVGDDKDKLYDLDSVVQMVVVGAKNAKPPAPARPVVSLSVPKPLDRTFLVYRPAFGTGKSDSFRMKLDGEEIQGNLSDFTRVQMTQQGGEWAMTTETPPAPARTGTYVGNFWWLCGEMPNGCVVVLANHGKSAGFTLNK